jgi:hypothetical protein
MRSCEYLSVSGERRAQLLCLRNVRFFLRRQELPHLDPRLALANTITIAFEYQKRDEHNETVTQHKAGDPLLCPVQIWVAVVQRVRAYPGSDNDLEVNTFDFSGESIKIQEPLSRVLSLLRAAVRSIGKDKLGFGADDVGPEHARLVLTCDL